MAAPATRKRYSGWKNPPPVSLISGSEDFLCRRVLNLAIKTAEANGRRVEFASDQEGVQDALSSAVLFSEPMLLVVTDPASLDEDLVKGHDDNTVALVLYMETDAPKGMKSVVEAVPKPYRFQFAKPPPYKAAENAIKFAVEEATKHGKVMPEPLAKALVEKVGSDLGVLSYEVLKVSTLLDARGWGSDIKPEHILQTMMLTGEANIGAIVDAVGAGSVRKTLRALTQVRENWSQGNDPTLAVVAWLGNRATSWLHVAALDEQGADEKEGAARSGLNPYVYTRFTLPVARRWGKARLITLLRHLSQVEASVKQGKIDPWTLLECSLIRSVRSVESAR